MIIRVDLSFVPENLRTIIVNSKELKDHAIAINDTSTEYQRGSNKLYLFEFSGYLSSFKGVLRLILQNRSIDDYIVTEDLESDNTFVILKQGDMEQLGISICDFCGLICGSEEEKNIHQRTHYFI